MTLGELIAKLEALDSAQRWTPGFGKSHSWRGVYKQVAFTPVESATVAEMLAHAQAAVGSTLHGWKGGEYQCGLTTHCNVAGEGEGEYGGSSDCMEVWWAANVETATLRSQLAASSAREATLREALAAVLDEEEKGRSCAKYGTTWRALQDWIKAHPDGGPRIVQAKAVLALPTPTAEDSHE